MEPEEIYLSQSFSVDGESWSAERKTLNFGGNRAATWVLRDVAERIDPEEVEDSPVFEFAQPIEPVLDVVTAMPPAGSEAAEYVKQPISVAMLLGTPVADVSWQRLVGRDGLDMVYSRGIAMLVFGRQQLGRVTSLQSNDSESYDLALRAQATGIFAYEGMAVIPAPSGMLECWGQRDATGLLVALFVDFAPFRE